MTIGAIWLFDRNFVELCEISMTGSEEGGVLDTDHSTGLADGRAEWFMATFGGTAKFGRVGEQLTLNDVQIWKGQLLCR